MRQSCFDGGCQLPLIYNAVMRVVIDSLLDGAARAHGLTVIIDVFRAFTTASVAFAQEPASYALVATSEAAVRLAARHTRPLLVGKAEPLSAVAYDLPNSPTLLARRGAAGCDVIHRSGAGAQGVLAARRASEVVTGSLVNAEAVARYILARGCDTVTLVSMGHEGGAAALEDELCARRIEAALRGQRFDLKPYLEALRTGSGKYFFQAMSEYPEDDFAACLSEDAFDFVLRARLHGDYAELERVGGSAAAG